MVRFSLPSQTSEGLLPSCSISHHNKNNKQAPRKGARLLYNQPSIAMKKPKKTKKTLYEKIWDAHIVREAADEPALLYIDLHLIHEVTSPQAFSGLEVRGLKVRKPD